jgi:lysophospholipase L1-like esterase
MRHDLQRYALVAALGPLLWLQGKYVRLVTPRLPEPPGARAGSAGEGPLLRVLLLGDSAAAGVGASSQDSALAGQLVQRLAAHFTIQWEMQARSGLDTATLLQLLQTAQSTPFDIVIVSIGVNDVTTLMPPVKWGEMQACLARAIQVKFEPIFVIHNAVPPMEHFTALPQPLRWFMGKWAAAMNRQLFESVENMPERLFFEPRLPDLPGGLAADGFHPGPLAYAVWAEGLYQKILAIYPRRSNH